MKLSERIKNIPNVHEDLDICRKVILEMRRDYDGFDYFQCDNEIDYKCIINYFDLKFDNTDNISEYPMTFKIFFDHNKGQRILTTYLLKGEIENVCNER